jgi:hypothetical protein
MKTRISTIIVLTLTVILLAFPAPVQATPPEPLNIEANLYLTGEDSASGSFEITGLITDAGTAFEVFFIADDTIHGVKTMVGSMGTIIIHFQARLTWTSLTTGVAEGSYVIVSGTGAYEKLHAVGETYAELDLVTGNILASYTGWAHID